MWCSQTRVETRQTPWPSTSSSDRAPSTPLRQTGLGEARPRTNRGSRKPPGSAFSFEGFFSGFPFIRGKPRVPQTHIITFLNFLFKKWSPRLEVRSKKPKLGTSLAVQWLSHCTSIVRSAGSIPGPGTKIPHAARRGQKI